MKTTRRFTAEDIRRVLIGHMMASGDWPLMETTGPIGAISALTAFIVVDGKLDAIEFEIEQIPGEVVQ